MDEMSVEKRWNEIGGRGKREKPREKPTQTLFRAPRNPHGVIETRTHDPSGGRRAPNRLRHEAAFFDELFLLNVHKGLINCESPLQDIGLKSRTHYIRDHNICLFKQTQLLFKVFNFRKQPMQSFRYI